MNLKKFYGSLIVFYFSDMSLLIMVMWLSYQLTKNPLILGTLIFISTITPFLIKRLSRLNLLSLPITHLMVVRIALYVLALALAFLPPTLYTFIGLALISGILGVSILSNYESYNNYLVLKRLISADKGSRYMQTVIQIGAFAGAMIGGFLLERFAFFHAMTIITAVDVLFCVLCLFWAKNHQLGQLGQLTHENSHAQSHTSSTPTTHKSPIMDKRTLYLLCALLGFLGVHVISFNITTPIIFQEIKHWSAQDFGLASAFAGAGAFLAVFLKSGLKRCLVMAALLIIADLLFVFLHIKALSLAACFFIGIFMNSVRIFARARLSLLAKDTAQAFSIGQYSAVSYTLFQAAASLVLGLLLANPASTTNITLLFLPAVACVVLILYVCWLISPAQKEVYS
ncbi:hypothetical protein B0181_03805 [Moraxella caviae]|uniref:Arabinose efflux permease n=1 Tax=Moraxella caviae TaxID=34060 RepID=A0A1T0A5P7_9GAMM|nr:MFS transporter [Moraxella caviae]OOR91066.1 hypothetical protein B0181_03805 [Moraxella caviae]STZ14240.1 Arabinose efflux permease [Moraxella caviae]VEW13176.1 Arabinose efflux permease [Moraxella caviae]